VKFPDKKYNKTGEKIAVIKGKSGPGRRLFADRKTPQIQLKNDLFRTEKQEKK
jgi:hypothetical protein